MKTLKEPKKFNKPRAYIRVNGEEKIEYNIDFRLRIIYPDGKAEWSNGYYLHGFFLEYPCWHKNYDTSEEHVRNKSKMTAEQAVKAMKAYDKRLGYKTLFIGEF